jgi:preprotein translocase subunit SecG
MNKFKKALIISGFIFGLHIILSFIYYYLQFNDFGYFGLVGGIFFAIIVGYWAYYAAVLIYLYINNNSKQIGLRLVNSIIIVSCGYIMYRFGDIIDGDFLDKFDPVLFTVFILSSILLVYLDKFIDRKMVNK